MSSNNEATLPLRPLTVGEVLDAAMALLRGNVARLLALAAIAAVAEQAALLPLRRWAGLTPPNYTADWWQSLGGWWLVLSVGLGTEAVIVTLLGAAAARRALPALLGPDADGLPRPTAGRIAAVCLTALLVGLTAAAGWLLGVVGWICCFLITGLLGPALLADLRQQAARWPGPGRPTGQPGQPWPAGPTGGLPGRPGPLTLAGPGAAVGHALRLVFRTGLRAGGIRLVNYLAWLLVRLALGWGVILALGRVVRVDSEFWSAALAMAAFALANTVAYAVAGCLDAVLLLECRVRSEGLDVRVRAARRRRAPVLEALTIPAKVRTSGWAGGPIGLPPPVPVVTAPVGPGVPR